MYKYRTNTLEKIGSEPAEDVGTPSTDSQRQCSLTCDPEALRIINWGPVDLLSGLLDGFFVDVPESVKAFAVVLVLCITPTAKVCREELGRLGNIRLRNHVRDRRSNLPRCDGVNVAPCETEKAIASRPDKLARHSICELDSLVFNGQTAHRHIIGANNPRRRGVVAI